MLRPTQLCLDDNILSIADIAINPEAVAELIPWELFEPVRVKYEKARFEHLKKETKKKNGEVKPRKGRPPKCAHKLFYISEEELEECRDEEPGIGGAPAYDFYSLLYAFSISPLYDCEANSASIWRELARNPGFVRACCFDPAEVPSVETLRRFNRIMSDEGLWGDISRITVENNIELGIIENTNTLVVDPTHHDGFASVKKPVKACRECKRLKDCKDIVYTCDVTDIVAKSKNYKLPGVKSVPVSLAGSEIPIAAMALNARVFDGKSLGDTLSFVKGRYPDLDIDTVIADGALDSVDNRKITRKVMKASLVTPVCPRRNKKKKVDARGIDHVDTYGIPVCAQGHRMELLGRDEKRGQYIWAALSITPPGRMRRLPARRNASALLPQQERQGLPHQRARVPPGQLGVPPALKEAQEALRHAHPDRENHIQGQEDAILREVLRQRQEGAPGVCRQVRHRLQSHRLRRLGDMNQ